MVVFMVVFMVRSVGRITYFPSSQHFLSMLKMGALPLCSLRFNTISELLIDTINEQ